VFKFITEPAKVLSDTQQKVFSAREFKLNCSLDESKDKLAAFLTTEFTAPAVTHQDHSYHLFAEKHAWCRLGVYVVHFSIIVIFLGAIIGGLFGYKAFVAIVEGETINAVQDRRSDKVIPLGFEVRCDQFSVSFYEGQGGGKMPKEFKSILTLTENGKEVPGYKHARVVVNDPLTYKGITFYQSSYGPASDPTTFFFTVKNRASGKEENIVLRPGASTKLAGGSQSVEIIDLTDNPGEGMAAVLVVRQVGVEPQFFKVYRENPTFDELRGDKLMFVFTGTDSKMYTGLQVAKDPGVWVVWTGCIMMCLGLYIAFFVSHKRVWIVVTKGYAKMYGNASKNQAVFQDEFDALAEKLKSQNI
jgi:cytochrome c biogenesis protein